MPRFLIDQDEGLVSAGIPRLLEKGFSVQHASRPREGESWFLLNLASEAVVEKMVVSGFTSVHDLLEPNRAVEREVPHHF